MSATVGWGDKPGFLRQPGAEIYRAIIENTLDIVSVLDSNGQVLYASPSVRAVLGYEPEELIGGNAFERIHPADVSRLRNLFDQTIQELGALEPSQFRYCHKDGSWRWFEAVAKSVSEWYGTTAVVVTSRDVTDRKQQAAALRDQVELLDLAHDAIVKCKLDGTVLFWNRSAERVYGWSREEALGKNASTLLHTRFPRPLPEILKILIGEGSWRGQIVDTTRDGTPVVIDSQWALKRDEMGQPAEILGINRDITERMQAEEQLRNLAARLQSAREEERTRIAREVHDQLGQMLTALRMDVLRIAGKAPEGEVLEDLRAVSALIDTTIGSVQQISTHLRPAILDDLGLGPAVEWQAQEFQERTGISCAVSTEAVKIQAGRRISTAVFRIYQEILTNVTRHAKATKVKVALRQEAGDLVLEVTDNGRGITDDELNGSGSLGLLGMRERARMMSGQIDFRAVPGNGTRVTVRIPARRSSAQRGRRTNRNENPDRRRSSDSPAGSKTNPRSRV
jgi:PAS domain S-box-containing protein